MITFLAQTPAQLGAVLRGYRRQRGLTQEQLAARVGLGQKAISVAETHADRIGVQSLFRILAALNVDLVIRDRTALKPPASGW